MKTETTREIATRVADSSILRDDLIDEVEKALNAERERCAKIADDHRDTAYRLEEAATERRDRVIAASRASLARSIAAAIRGSNH